MIRYILVGGYPWKATDGGKAFAEACVEGTKDPAIILVCLFAREESEWGQAYSEDIARFTAQLPDRQLKFIMATREQFAEQVAQADVIYLRGGATEQLVTALRENIAWLDNLDGKTLVGTSTGADAIATYYYGLGLLPIKVLVHYESDYGDGTINWREVYKDLDAYKESLEVLPIREGQFVTRKVTKCVY